MSHTSGICRVLCMHLWIRFPQQKELECFHIDEQSHYTTPFSRLCGKNLRLQVSEL